MKTVFVDSNVFLRFVTTDDEGQHKKAAELLRKARGGKIALVTGPPVFFEIAWTLRAAYDYPREATLQLLRSLMAMPGLTVLDQEIVADALDLAQERAQDFADAYIAISARRAGAEAIATFNRRHFEKLGVELHPL